LVDDLGKIMRLQSYR